MNIVIPIGEIAIGAGLVGLGVYQCSNSEKSKASKVAGAFITLFGGVLFADGASGGELSSRAIEMIHLNISGAKNGVCTALQNQMKSTCNRSCEEIIDYYPREFRCRFIGNLSPLCKGVQLENIPFYKTVCTVINDFPDCFNIPKYC